MSEVLPTSRCKRMLRPLVAKIHALTDLSIKFPQQVAVEVPRADDTRFLKPSSSAERLALLKPYTSEDLYQGYIELFGIFRNLVTTLCPNTTPRLSTQCLFRLGKSIALTTRTTYYQLNQSRLFNPNETKHRDVLQHLSEDIDEWLELDPQPITREYRAEFLLGYIVHLVMFSLQQVLFMVIPVMVHWLHEQDKPVMALLKQTMFRAYWTYGANERETDGDLRVLHGQNDSLLTFWELHRLGYWQHFVEQLHLRGEYDMYDPFSGLMVMVLAIDSRVDVQLWEKIGVDPETVYKYLKATPQHPLANMAVANVVSLVMGALKSAMAQRTTAERAVAHLEAAIARSCQIIRAWLSFPGSPVVFNSLQPGNKDIFAGLRSLSKYVVTVATSMASRLNGDHPLISPVDTLVSRAQAWATTICILEAYYLELEYDFDYSPDVFDMFLHLQHELEPSKELLDFLYWLAPVSVSMARRCFRHVYGRERVYPEPEKSLHHLLFQ